MTKLRMKSRNEILSDQSDKIKEALTTLEALDIPLPILNDINTVLMKLEILNDRTNN